ncbi:hypothetical protein OPQ81_011389 [Rhizoctonia solani]|nr:hypothetical protein OPQ81_011389 [Rhizoctonia solani]
MDLDGDMVWVAGKYLSTEPTNGGSAHIPDLCHHLADGSTQTTSSNEDKSKVLLDAFFPAPAMDLPNFTFPNPPSEPMPDLKVLT